MEESPASDAQDRPDGFVELVIQEIDRMGYSLSRDEGVVTKDHICRFSFMRQRQAQPKLDEMFFIYARSADNALGGPQSLSHVVVNRVPIAFLLAPIDIVEEKPGNLALVNIAQTSSGKTHLQPTIGPLKQADIGQQPRKMCRADVISGRHVATAGNCSPIIIELPLLSNNQLGPKGHI